MFTNCLAACAHLTITVSEIERDIGRKSSIAFEASVKEVATTWWKNFEDIFIRFGATHERDGQTDRQTPGDGIYRAYAQHRAVKRVNDVAKIPLATRNARTSRNNTVSTSHTTPAGDPNISSGHTPTGHFPSRTIPPPFLHGVGHFPLPPSSTNLQYKEIYRYRVHMIALRVRNMS